MSSTPSAAPTRPGETMLWQTVIHLAFVVSAVALAWIDRLSQTAHAARVRPEPATRP